MADSYTQQMMTEADKRMTAAELEKELLEVTDGELIGLLEETKDRPLSLTHRLAREVRRRRANDLTSYDRDNLRFALRCIEADRANPNHAAEDANNWQDNWASAIATLEMVIKRDASPIVRLTELDKKALLWLQRNLTEVCGQKMSDTFHDEVCGALDKVLTHG